MSAPFRNASFFVGNENVVIGDDDAGDGDGSNESVMTQQHENEGDNQPGVSNPDRNQRTPSPTTLPMSLEHPTALVNSTSFQSTPTNQQPIDPSSYKSPSIPTTQPSTLNEGLVPTSEQRETNRQLQ